MVVYCVKGIWGVEAEYFQLLDIYINFWMNSRQAKLADTAEKKTGARKKTSGEKAQVLDQSRQSREKTAGRHKRQKTNGRGAAPDSRYLKKGAAKKESVFALETETNNRSEPAERPKKRATREKMKIITTESNDRSLDLTESSYQGQSMLQEALKSTKFVEAKYFEVLGKLQAMKKKEKKVDDSRVNHLELAVDRLTKENQHLKYQLANIQETIQDKSETSHTKKNKESAEIMDSLRKFEMREKELADRLKEIEQLVKPPASGQEANLKRDVGSQSKSTMVNRGCRSVHNRSSINTNKTRSDRIASPMNFKRLLNQAADQLINDPNVGKRAPSVERLLNAKLQTKSQANLHSRAHNAESNTKTKYLIETMQRAVMQVAAECKNLRQDSREVFSKLDNIERVLEK